MSMFMPNATLQLEDVKKVTSWPCSNWSHHKFYTLKRPVSRKYGFRFKFSILWGGIQKFPDWVD